MLNNSFSKLLIAIAAGVSLLGTTGCQNLPGQPKTQGAVIGGVGGAAAGAAIGGQKHQVLGALLGGALGAGAGYVVGANSDRWNNHDTAGATHATQQAQAQPATVEQARTASTADLNTDGFVTLDEVGAMRDAGFSDAEMIQRLRATGQVFELTNEQENYLRNRGVSENVIEQMRGLNRNTAPQSDNSGIISRPAGQNY